VSLAAVKETAHRLDAKVNDVLLAALSGSLRGYLRQRDYPVDDLVFHVVVPVNLRPAERALELGNKFGLAYAPLDLSIRDPVERLLSVKRDMDRIKSSVEPLVYFGLLGLFGLAPRAVEQEALAWFGSKATAVMTNVAGPRETMYMAGSPIENMMFWVPQSGQLGLGVSVLSYDGNVTLGVISDGALVADPDKIANRFAKEVAKLEKRSLAVGKAG
jgi:WS/DGAT/MGAT family acyltransferase